LKQGQEPTHRGDADANAGSFTEHQNLLWI
jgi:hypothetical protein